MDNDLLRRLSSAQDAYMAIFVSFERGPERPSLLSVLFCFPQAAQGVPDRAVCIVQSGFEIDSKKEGSMDVNELESAGFVWPCILGITNFKELLLLRELPGSEWALRWRGFNHLTVNGCVQAFGVNVVEGSFNQPHFQANSAVSARPCSPFVIESVISFRQSTDSIDVWMQDRRSESTKASLSRASFFVVHRWKWSHLFQKGYRDKAI